MSDLLSEKQFTERLVTHLAPLSIPISVPEPLLVELNYGNGEPVLSIALSKVYEAYKAAPEQLESLLQPYIVEIGWTAQQPRYAAKEILENTMPVMKDIPEVFYSSMLEKEDGPGPFGSKGMSQTSIVTVAPAIGNAVYDALGVRIRSLPITPEKILRAMGKI